MKTSISEIIRAEKFLQGELSPEESVVFQARLLVDQELKTNTFFHGMVHRMITLYNRRKLRCEVDALHERLFHDPAKMKFRESIVKLFNP